MRLPQMTRGHIYKLCLALLNFCHQDLQDGKEGNNLPLRRNNRHMPDIVLRHQADNIINIRCFFRDHQIQCHIIGNWLIFNRVAIFCKGLDDIMF